jgi:uncharacterized protein YbaR (Trm112 family)/SAM-dependent methyltransferase
MEQTLVVQMMQQERVLTLVCPRDRSSLTPEPEGSLVSHGAEKYPVVDGIPVLLPDPAERASVAAADGASHGGTDPASFYNQERDHDQYCRETLTDVEVQIREWVDRLGVPGPVVEIGSGKGALQGVAEPYVAFDYSLTALRKYVSPKYQRVCGTASQLPFADRSAGMVFTIAALEHVPEAGDAIHEIDRVLMPGGWAFLSPAWHCVQYNCDGLPVRPYGDLTMTQKMRKAMLPVMMHPLYKACVNILPRIVRRAGWALGGRRPTCFRFKRLRPTYDVFWLSDSDAASRLDSHEACLFFASRGYEMLTQPTLHQQLFARHEPVVVRKPL